jgi:hypothetical protein
MFETDKDILAFKPKYPHTLPQDWKNEENPTVYEVKNIILPRLFWCQNADVVDHSRRYQPAHHQ